MLNIVDLRTSNTLALARSMREANDYSALPILADALEEAGCEDAEVLGHCRQGEKCRRCKGTGADNAKCPKCKEGPDSAGIIQHTDDCFGTSEPADDCRDCEGSGFTIPRSSWLCTLLLADSTASYLRAVCEGREVDIVPDPHY